MIVNRRIQIQALKYPNRPHYEYEAKVLELTEDYVLVLCEAGRELIHHTRGAVFTKQTASIEYLSFTQWHTVAAELNANHEIIAYYCNVAKPSVLQGDVLQFVDLDIDLIKHGTGPWHVVDEAEFAVNRIRFSYPETLVTATFRALDILKHRARQGFFPFNENLPDRLL